LLWVFCSPPDFPGRVLPAFFPFSVPCGDPALRKRTLLLAATLTTGLLTALPATTATAAPSKLAGDFNGDGYRDLAIGAPNATVSGKPQAGYVGIVYGTKNGLNTAKRQVISQSTAGIPGAPESGDYFGVVVEEEPSLSTQIVGLKWEHMIMLHAADVLCELAKDRGRWLYLSAPTRELVAELERHEQAESKLLRNLFFAKP
jgi:hypothetical protein